MRQFKKRILQGIYKQNVNRKKSCSLIAIIVINNIQYPFQVDLNYEPISLHNKGKCLKKKSKLGNTIGIVKRQLYVLMKSKYVQFQISNVACGFPSTLPEY